MKLNFLLLTLLFFNVLLGQITTTKIAENKGTLSNQTYDSLTNFLGVDVTNYLGQELYLNKKSESRRKYGYDGFYVDYNKGKSDGGVYKCCDSYNSKYDDLAGKYFKVLEIIKHPKASKNEYLYGKKFYLKLEEEQSKDIVYYEYDTNYEYLFPFIVVGLFEKLKKICIGQSYVFGETILSFLDGTLDISTGKPIVFTLGSKWECIDITIEEKYYNLSLILKDKNEQKMAISYDRVVGPKKLQDFFTTIESDKDKQKLRTDIKILTDTTMAVGIIGEDCYVGKSIGSYCINGFDKSLSKGTAILISGIENCKRSQSNVVTQYFEIVYNKQTYYIEKEKLLTGQTYYEQIENMTSEKVVSFRAHAQYLSEALYEVDTKKALKFLDGCKTKGLAILDWSYYDESENTEGTSVRIKVYNPTQKAIKYLWFTFLGFNPVGDKVIDRKRGINITMKGVGPLKPDENGTYEYSYVWFTDLVETARITSIKVQYIDGSFKTIANPKDIMLPKNLYSLLFDEE